MRLDIEKLSKKGGRKFNEDACDYLPSANITCCVLSDGLGGHHGGAVASSLAVRGVLDAFKEVSSCSPQTVQFLLRNAENEIVKEQRKNEELREMRATAVVLIIDSSRRIATWGHIGDSRLYCLRKREIIVQTRDHSISQSLVDAGYIRPEELRSASTRNQIYASLGNKEGDQLKIDVLPSIFPVESGDVFLMCSDGLWEYIEESEMESTLSFASSAREWLIALEKLVLARGHETHDNYSAIAVMCKD